MSVTNAGLAKITAGIVVLVASFIACAAQERPPAPSPSISPAPLFSPQQLDQMLTPIALYPDPLIAQILMAATYPLEVVEADRWLQVPANAALKGDQLALALQQQPWDPSVKSLVPFPRILKMMDENLEWTEKLGDAFLAQQADVMDSVQRLRRRAKAAGALASTAQQVVSTEDNIITLVPAVPGVVYVPIYNPTLVYGVWPWPEYPPFYFWPWPGFVIGFGIGIPIVYPLWGWCHWHWRHHPVHIDAHRFNEINVHRPPVTSDIWQHSLLHRDGVPYRDPVTRARFRGSVSPQARLALRGYPVGVPPHGVVHAPPVFESFGRGPEVRAHAERGTSSMGSFRAGGRGFGGGGGVRR
jgi:Protein of unknown function (DUF3300)